MATLNDTVTTCLARWRRDLRENLSGIIQDPFAQHRGRRWERDFLGEISQSDIYHSVFLVALCLVSAALLAMVSTAGQVDRMMQFFRAPLQVVLTGFLSSSLIFLGSHLNKVPKDYTVAFKLMLRIMSVYPILFLLNVWKFGEPFILIAFGFFLIRGVVRTYSIALRNAVLFFGVIYFVFAVMQLQAIFNPNSQADRLQYLSRPPEQ